MSPIHSRRTLPRWQTRRKLAEMIVKEHGPWKIRNSRDVYKDPWIEVRKDDVIRPDGADGTHCVVNMKPGVSVLPLDDQGFVYLTEEFH